MKAKTNRAMILAAMRRELQSLLEGRRIAPGKRLRLSGDWVCLTAESDPSAPNRLVLRMDPLIRPYVQEEILQGIQGALEGERDRVDDVERKRQLDHQIAKLRMPPPTRAMLDRFTLRCFHLEGGRMASLGEIVFDAEGDAELVLPEGSPVSVGFEAPELTFRVLDSPATPANVIDLRWAETEVTAVGAESLALAAAAAAEDTEEVRDDRILRDDTDPSGLRLFATPVGGGERSRLMVESPDGGLDGKTIVLDVHGRDVRRHVGLGSGSVRGPHRT